MDFREENNMYSRTTTTKIEAIFFLNILCYYMIAVRIYRSVVKLAPPGPLSTPISI